MNSNERIGAAPEVNRLGALLFVLATAAVVVAYPPLSAASTVGLFGGLYAAVAGLLLAALGGALLSRAVAGTDAGRPLRLGLRVVVAVASVALIAVYLVTVAGYGVRAPMFPGAAAIAVLGSVVDELVG